MMSLTILIFAALLQSDKSQNPYLAMRKRALDLSRKDLRISNNGKPFGALMEFAQGSATVTIVAFSDSTTSIYLSTGGGFIGGGEHAAIRRAGEKFIGKASIFQSQMEKASLFPLPKSESVNFYLKTDKGVLMAKKSMSKLGHFKPLFNAAQEVITQYRLAESR